MLSVVLNHLHPSMQMLESASAAMFQRFYLDGVEEERSMHGFSDDLHPSEGERQVGQTPADPGAWQCFLQVKKHNDYYQIIMSENNNKTRKRGRDRQRETERDGD